MALSGQMDYAIDILFLYQPVDSVKVTDVHPDEAVVGPVLNVPEVGQVAGIGQLVQVDDPVFRVLVDEQSHYVASNEACTSGYDYILHFSPNFPLLLAVNCFH